MRQSFTINWLEKPFYVWRIIEPQVQSSFMNDASQIPAWFEARRAEYLEGFEAGEYGLPIDLLNWVLPIDHGDLMCAGKKLLN